MKIIITIKDTNNIIGLKEDIAMRLEGVADIVRIDTADVVPKSEVAREIFEEIDSTIIAEIDLSNSVLIEFDGAEEIYNRTKGEVSALCKLWDFIAELKKKYTE